MRIAVDLDGVVYDFVDALRNYRVSKGIPYETMPEPQTWDMWGDWGCSKHEFVQSMVEAEAAGLFHQGKAYAGALDAINELKGAGHSIHIITHRLRPQAQTSTIGWLASNNVPYDTLTFTENKCGYPVDVCIEDNIDNAQAIEASGVPCVLLTRPWNEKHDYRHRVSSWNEFVEIVDERHPEWMWEFHKQRSATSKEPVEGRQPYRMDADEVAGGFRTVGEVREVSATGGEKGAKPEQYSMIPVSALAEVARVYENGAQKYSRDNWRKGYRWSLSYDAMQRHINAFWAGEEFNPDSGLHHLGHAVFHCFTLMSFGGDLEQYARYDDRYREVPG